MAHGREIWRGTLQLRKGEKWKIRLLIAYCGTKDHSARVTICRIQNPRLQQSEEKAVRLKHARLGHISFESLDATPEGEPQSQSKNEFQLITHGNETLEFRLESDLKCLEWVKVLTILITYPNVYMPWETQNPVTFHSKPDPYVYGSDLVWAVFVMHTGIAKKGLVVGVNVVALRNTTHGAKSAPTLDLIYPQDPTNKIACWEKEKVNAVGRMGKLVFLEISKDCEPGGGLVWMYVGYGEEVGLYENVKKFLYQGDESFVHTKSHQLLTHDYTRRPFHSGTPPSMDEDSDLPILDLQQQSLVEQVMEQWGHGAAGNMTLEGIPPSSPPTTNSPELQQHPTQPVTVSSFPDYPRTVKFQTTQQPHSQPVASKSDPEHSPTTKSVDFQHHSTQTVAAKSVADYPRTVKSQGTQYRPQLSTPDHSPTTKSLGPQQHLPTQPVVANPVPNYSRTVKSQGTWQHHSQLEASKSTSYHPPTTKSLDPQQHLPTQPVVANPVPDYSRTVKSQGTRQHHSQLEASKSTSYHPPTNAMEPQQYPTQSVAVNAKLSPDHPRTVKSLVEQHNSLSVVQKSAPDHPRTMKSLETQHHVHAQRVAAKTTPDHPQTMKSLGPQHHLAQPVVASDHLRTVKFMEPQKHHTQAVGAKSTERTKLSAMTSLGDRHYHTEDVTTARSPSDHGLPPSSPRTTKDTKTSEPQLKDLVLELRHIQGWFYLGVCLGIPQSTLDQIHASYGTSLDATEVCKMQLLSTWRDGSSSGCTWSAVVTALHQTGRAGLAKTIADKYDSLSQRRYEKCGNCGATVLGTSQQLEDRFPQQFKEIVLTDQQASAIVSLRKKIEMEDKKLLETERCLKEHKQYNQALEDKLEKLREELHFSARYRGKQLSDLQLLQMKKRENEIHIQTLEQKFQNLTDHRRLVAPSDQNELQQTMELLREKAEESHEIRQQLSQTLPKQEYAYKAAKELKERLADVTFQCENVAKTIQQLQAEREELSAALKSHEKKVDQILIGTQHEQHMSEYYNVILCEDGRVELKLKEAEIERYMEELQKKEAHIRMLKDKLEDKMMKLSEMDECIQKLEQEKMNFDTLLDSYEYVYHGGYGSTTELHLAEQISNMFAVEWLQYKIQLLREEANKRELLFQVSSLSQRVDEMSSTLEAMAGTSVPPAQPAARGQPLHQSYSAEQLGGLPVLPNSVNLQNELPSQSRQSPPTSQSTYYQSHPPSVLTRQQPVRAAALVPTTRRFTSENENISLLGPGPRTMNPLMYRHELSPPENSSHFRYSMHGDHGVSSMSHASSTQHEVRSHDPVQREKQATSV